MTHSYKQHYFHLIWSTKLRISLITPDVQARLYPYLGAITRNYSGELLEIGGMSEHVHLLVKLSLLDKFSCFIRDLKACSSQWINQNFPNLPAFAWQEGFGSFSVSYSGVNNVRKYIQDQEYHHASMSFEEEYLKFLRVHGIEYDERFVFG